VKLMANWVQLTESGGGRIWVNLDEALFLRPFGTQTHIKFEDEVGVTVDEDTRRTFRVSRKTADVESD
jgi:hypothetical protein